MRRRGLRRRLRVLRSMREELGAKLMMKLMGFAEALEPLVKEWVIKAIEEYYQGYRSGLDCDFGGWWCG
jgi:hypothetical protein